MPFNSLDLPEYLLKVLEKLSYSEPTSVQERVIPEVLQGHDLIVEAQTGTGKTAAYILPFVKLFNDLPHEGSRSIIRNLTLVPTRELAMQVTLFYSSYTEFSPKKIKALALIGGESLDHQIIALQKGVDVVVATPGRLLQLLELGEIQLHDITTFIIDEADKLFSLEFTEQLQELLKQIPPKRQNLLFSATLPPKVIKLSCLILSNPKRISIIPHQSNLENIHQRVIEVNRENRRALLQHLIKNEKLENAIVFVATKKAAFNLGQKLHRAGFSVDSFHGDLAQEERTEILKDFKDKEFSILISTDIAARGIDITKLSAVVNYDLPRSPLEYIHRIGRTGRAGEKGKAITFIDHIDQDHFKLIEKKANIHLEHEQIEGFELLGENPTKVKGKAPVKGKRKSKKDKLRMQQVEDKTIEVNASTDLVKSISGIDERS